MERRRATSGESYVRLKASGKGMAGALSRATARSLSEPAEAFDRFLITTIELRQFPTGSLDELDALLISELYHPIPLSRTMRMTVASASVPLLP